MMLLVVCSANGIAATAQQKKLPNVILITLDGLRTDRAGFLGSHAGLTPNLDRLAAGSMVFTQAYAQTPLTIASGATLLTGTYPQINRASALGVLLPRGVPYLPEQLHAHGYRTAAFVDSQQLDPKSGPFQGYDQGFDNYTTEAFQPERRPNAQTDAHGVEATVSRAAKWLPTSQTQPLFLWVHLSPAPATSAAGYDRGIAATDRAVGQFVAALKLKGLYDDSVVVVASLHGESLGAHGEQMSGMFLYDETIHVPLLLKSPGNNGPAKQVRGRVGLLDVSPTLLEMAGMAVPPAMQGHSLLRIAMLGPQSDLPAYARSQLPSQGFACSTIESLRSGKYLYIDSARPELYDLSADPDASHNLAASSPAKVQVLANQLANFDHRLAGNATSSEAGLTLSETQKLASLGYVGMASSKGVVAPKLSGIDPKDAIGAANKTLLGFIALNEGKTQPAIEQFRAVLSQRQSIYLAQYGMGVALARQQQYAQSIEFLRRAINLQPESAFAHYAMGMSLIKAGDLKTASVHLEIAARLLPAFAELHIQLAQVYDHLGRANNAARP